MRKHHSIRRARRARRTVAGSVLGLATIGVLAQTASATPAPGTPLWTVSPKGQVVPLGTSPDLGSPKQPLSAPLTAAAPTPDGNGYWLAGADGGVFSYGDAGFYGSAAPARPHAPIVAVAPTPDGKGYWLAGADGGVFSYGDAGFYGSAGGVPVAASTGTILPTAAGDGYWVVMRDVTIRSFGAANSAVRPATVVMQQGTPRMLAAAAPAAPAPGDVALSYARQHIGAPYAWGATGPSAFD
ncbi:MAG TPA: hypothetical protein VFH45_10855, partial [Acidimicrobiales bacterium]|nr:hypothetical protein [Acidimicrobiales bacterium]